MQQGETRRSGLGRICRPSAYVQKLGEAITVPKSAIITRIAPATIEEGESSGIAEGDAFDRVRSRLGLK